MDYKTGKVDAKKLTFKAENLDELFQKPEHSQLIQLLCYVYLYQNSNHPLLIPTQEFQCGIIAFQELFKQNDEYICYAQIDKDKSLTNKILHVFEVHLKQLFSSILDTKTAFCQTNEAENCIYCDYKNICGK